MTMNLKLAKKMVKSKHYILENWSSLVLWNCAHPSNQAVTKELVNDPDIAGKYLHRFSWLKDEEIGAISHEWNWLVGWYQEPDDGKPSEFTILKAARGLKIIEIVNIVNTGKKLLMK